MLSSRVNDLKSERIEAACARAKDRLGPDEQAEFERFVKAFYARVAPADIVDQSLENLYGATLALWKFAARRASGEARVRIYNPRFIEHGWKSPHTIVEICHDDMPFLVDSISAALSRQDCQVLLAIHPVVRVLRDAEGLRTGLLDGSDGTGDGDAEAAIAESMVHIEINEQSDPERMAELQQIIEASLADVRAAVLDWRAMTDRLRESIAELRSSKADLDEDERTEVLAFLSWLADNHFTFLGCREYRYQARGRRRELTVVPDSGLGILRDPDRQVLAGGTAKDGLAPIVQQFLERQELMLITKTSVRSRVHRPVHMDIVGLKRFDKAGKLVGERRFVGLFTSSAYNRTPRDIPLLRRKVAQVVERARLSPTGHHGKALMHILETYPRDELFQIDNDTLFTIATGILDLQERPQIRLFPRRDKFDRYFSCIIFVPRDRMDTGLRLRFEEILVSSLNGRISNYYTQVADSPLARLHYIIGTDPGAAPDPVDWDQIEHRFVAAARSWHDALSEALIERFGEADGHRLAKRYGAAFGAGYTDRFNAELAIADIGKIEALSEHDVALNLYRAIEDPDHVARLKIYNPGHAVPLSNCLPMLEHMGMHVISEHPFEVRLPGDAGSVFVQDFEMREPHGDELDLSRIKAQFEAAFAEVWSGRLEDDNFNALVVRADLGFRDVVIVRAYCKYLRQTGIAFSQSYMQQTLGQHPAIVRTLIDLFQARFDPAFKGKRNVAIARLKETVETALETVSSLDEDRILRRYLNAINATTRTNHFQRADDGSAKTYLSLKFDSLSVDELPLPRPFREIFVYSPRTEGVHLRGGKVARGGLRWSDRREDFRTEVLGLMKAQMVKNAVIVPVGSKGGFVAKRLPPSGEREAVQAEVVACYKTFIRGLLDVTDNLLAGRARRPADVVAYDDEDTYLVVAADKGTATFSDIANEIALEYGFWLGDAFASGGANGYDHKRMGITARGAWESVRRHFRELGTDVENDPIRAIGVGDMSGDVFGNGMLLSRSLKLVAAFDHRHVFIDPEPDPEKSWRERERLFQLPRSSWEDYSSSLISSGGGVFARSLKSIPLSPEMKALSGLRQDAVMPNELIHALLQAPVELLWFGGIGTFVKSAEENDAEVGDRANDAIRVSAQQLRCKVIGEGGNLGMTQRARIAFAANGGRLNTDAVDNSAGVDCSDHEVNIKILLGAIVDDGEMTPKQRDRLLAEMTDEVGALVLQNNYQQNQTLSVLQRQASALIESHGQFIRALERSGRLDRAVEFLPSDEDIAERAAGERGLTRPELAVLLAYAKMELYDELVDSDLNESAYLSTDIERYFPRPIVERFGRAIAGHRLRREIIATVTANSLVNRTSITFTREVIAETGLPASAVARAYAVVREAFGLRELWAQIEALDNQVPAQTQIEMLQRASDLIKHACLWCLRNLAHPIRIVPTLQTFAPGIADLTAGLEDILGEGARASMSATAGALVQRGVPDPLARRVAALDPLTAALDVVQVARTRDRSVHDVGRIYFTLGDVLELDWLREQAADMAGDGHWDRLAIASLVDDLFSQQRALTGIVLDRAARAPGAEAVQKWLAGSRQRLQSTYELIDEFRNSGPLNISRLAVANRSIRRLIVG